MLVTSSQSSTQRPLGLSVEELFALDRQYRHMEQQQQQQQQRFIHQQAQARLTSSNLNRLASRSLDLVSTTAPVSLSVLPAVELQGHGYSTRLPATSSILTYPRSSSIDQLRYNPTCLSTPPLLSPASTLLRPTYQPRTAINDSQALHYHPRHRIYSQPPTMATSPPNNLLYNMSPSSMDYYDTRNSCKLRRQQPVKRESSRRILVRPFIQRRREPSVSSSCESLDDAHMSNQSARTEQANLSHRTVSFSPSAALIADVIDGLQEETNQLARTSSYHDSLSDESDVNLYEMRVPIGKTYDTSDISVQLEGPKILIHCHTIEPTDKRGNYRKHEFRTELLVPDVVDDETIVAYLTEDGQLIVEGKYQPWAWKEILQKRKIEQKKFHSSSSPILSPTPASTRHDGGLEPDRTPTTSSSSQRLSHFNHLPSNRIERLENNRTVIHVGEPVVVSPQPSADARSVTDIINRFNTLHVAPSPTLWDGQYSFTNDTPALLVYHVRLPTEFTMDSIRIQSDPQMNLLKVSVEQPERGASVLLQSTTKPPVRSPPRIYRLPRDFIYDFAHLRVIFLKDNFIRIELPTLN